VIHDRPDGERRARAAKALIRLRPGLAAEARRLLGPAEADAFLTRLDVRFTDVHAPIESLYGDGDALVERLLRLALRAAAARPPSCAPSTAAGRSTRAGTSTRGMVGYVAYTDRFAGTLRGLHDRLDHLAELGVTYLHLMPLLAPREGENDGGYAVADYRAVDPAWARWTTCPSSRRPCAGAG
jgi:amylosucrase